MEPEEEVRLEEELLAEMGDVEEAVAELKEEEEGEGEAEVGEQEEEERIRDAASPEVSFSWSLHDYFYY